MIDPWDIDRMQWEPYSQAVERMGPQYGRDYSEFTSPRRNLWENRKIPPTSPYGWGGITEGTMSSGEEYLALLQRLFQRLTGGSRSTRQKATALDLEGEPRQLSDEALRVYGQCLLEAGAPRIDLQNLINLWRERKEGYIPREYRQAFEEYKPPKKAALSPDTRDLILNQLAPLGEKGAFSENRMKAELLLRKFEESGLNPAILAPDERGVLGVGPKFQAMWERFNPRKTAIPFNADRTAINLTTGQRLPANQWFPGEEPTGPFYRPMNLPTAKRLASTDEFGRPQLNLPQRPQLDPEIVRRQLWLRRLTGQEGPLSPEDYLGRTVRGLLDTLGFRQPSPMEQEWFQKLGVPSW